MKQSLKQFNHIKQNTMETNVVTVFEIKHPNGEVQTAHSHATPGQPTATSAFTTAKSKSGIAILKGFVINGIFKAVDLRDHFQRMADRNK